LNRDQIALLEAGSKIINGNSPEVSYHLPFVLRRTFVNKENGSIICKVMLPNSDELTKQEREMIEIPTGLNIFTVYTADEWFSRSSMRLIGVFTSDRIMVEELKKIMPEDTLNDLMRFNQAVSAEYNYIVENLKLNKCE
jgi:hypothetical protein